MLSDRDVWLKAGVIVAEHGTGAAAYIITQLCDVIDDLVAVHDWRRVANAVDAITEVNSTGAN